MTSRHEPYERQIARMSDASCGGPPRSLPASAFATSDAQYRLTRALTVGTIPSSPSGGRSATPSFEPSRRALRIRGTAHRNRMREMMLTRPVPFGPSGSIFPGNFAPRARLARDRDTWKGRTDRLWCQSRSLFRPQSTPRSSRQPEGTAPPRRTSSAAPSWGASSSTMSRRRPSIAARRAARTCVARDLEPTSPRLRPRRRAATRPGPAL